MAENFHWSCPYCNRDTTITGADFSEGQHNFNNSNKDGLSSLITRVIVCPNEQCKEYTINATLYSVSRVMNNLGAYSTSQEIRLEWNLKPKSLAKQFPDYIPKAILDDYKEACLIKELSPKASATLSRRCVQGIIRDFFGVSKGRLIDEIKAIKDKVDPTTWEAIDAIRSIGNIGAHMEKDINLIIDVDPREAQILIGLIEILIKDWYIARNERQKSLESIIGIADDKAEKKKAGKSKPKVSQSEG